MSEKEKRPKRGGEGGKERKGWKNYVFEEIFDKVENSVMTRTTR